MDLMPLTYEVKTLKSAKKITAVIVARDSLFSFPKETILLKNE